MGNLGKVTFNYTASQPDELDLREGEYVMIVKEEPEDDGWGLARKFAYKGDVVVGYGSEGLIPLNFLEILTQPPANIAHFLEGPTQQNSASSANALRNKVQAPAEPSHNVSAIAYKDSALADGMAGQAPSITGMKVAQLKQTLGSDENFLAAVKGTPKQPGGSANGVAHTKEERIIAHAEVTFDYAAQQPDELNLTEHQIIQVLSKDADVGWWKGIDPQGKIGVFPHNFVKEIAMSDKKQEIEEAREGKPLPTVKNDIKEEPVPIPSKPLIEKATEKPSPEPLAATPAKSAPNHTNTSRPASASEPDRRHKESLQALSKSFAVWQTDTQAWLEEEMGRLRAGLQERLNLFEQTLSKASAN